MMKTNQLLFTALLMLGVVSNVRAQYPVSAHVNPTADAHVRDGAFAYQNYGTAAVMESQSSSFSGESRIIYLTFDVSQASPDVKSVKLRIYGSYAVSGSVPVAIYPVAYTGWNEKAITWNTRPATGSSMLSGVNVTNTPGYWVFDVTNYAKSQRLAGRTKISLALKNLVRTNSRINWNSKEAFFEYPVLEIVNEWVGMAEVIRETNITAADEGENKIASLPGRDYPPVVHEGAYQDTYVRDGIYANDDFYGSYGNMESRYTASTGFNRIAYLIFDVSQASPALESVKVRIYGSYTGPGIVPVGIYSVASTGWSNISWNTRPATSSSALATTYVSNSAQFWEWDVTSYVRNQRLAGKTKVAFALRNQATTPYIVNWSSSNAFYQYPDMEIINVWIPKAGEKRLAAEPVQSKCLSALNTYPNPAAENLAVVFESRDHAPAFIRVSDLASRKVAEYEVSVVKGHNRFDLDLPELTDGIYFFSLMKGEERLSKKIVIRR